MEEDEEATITNIETFYYENNSLFIIKTNNMIYYPAEDVARYIGFKGPYAIIDAIENIDDHYKTMYSHLLDNYPTLIRCMYIYPDKIYINEYGFYDLFLRACNYNYAEDIIKFMMFIKLQVRAPQKEQISDNTLLLISKRNKAQSHQEMKMRHKLEMIQTEEEEYIQEKA